MANIVFQKKNYSIKKLNNCRYCCYFTQIKKMNDIQIGNKIRKIREFRGIKQETIANELGLSISGYSKIERGETQITLDRLELISKILEVKVIDLLQFDEKNIFNIETMNNSAIRDIVNNYTLSEKEKTIYLEHITKLTETLSKQSILLDKLISKIPEK